MSDNADRILELEREAGDMRKHIRDLTRRVTAHIKGESGKGFCKKCTKPYWNVDDEDCTCPFCGHQDFPVHDIDATIIAEV